MIAVIGAGGQLGSAFMRHLGPEATGFLRHQLNLTERDQVRDWMRLKRPQVVINCAAYTSVDSAETDQELAMAVNAEAVLVLAEEATRVGARLVTFSSDYVFDGTKPESYVESDPPNPLNVYGRSKLAGERAALQVAPETLVVRTAWLMSSTHRNFASVILGLLGQGPVQVVSDQVGSPTIVDDLVPVVLEAIGMQLSGVVHMCGQGTASWHQLAVEIAQSAGINPALVEATTTDRRPTPARRPKNSVLRSEVAPLVGLSQLPHYGDGLDRLVAALQSNS